MEQASGRRLQQAENKIAALQAASNSCSNQLAQLQMGITNMYSIARHYQKSLPPPPSCVIGMGGGSGPRSKDAGSATKKKRDTSAKLAKNSPEEALARQKDRILQDKEAVTTQEGSSQVSKLLRSLHNFLQDATTTIKLAEQIECPDSNRPTLGSSIHPGAADR